MNAESLEARPQIANFEAGKFPETIEFEGNTFTRSNELAGKGMVYGREVRTEYPAEQELLIVDSDGNIVTRLRPTEKDVVNRSMEGRT